MTASRVQVTWSSQRRACPGGERAPSARGVAVAMSSPCGARSVARRRRRGRRGRRRARSAVVSARGIGRYVRVFTSVFLSVAVLYERRAGRQRMSSAATEPDGLEPWWPGRGRRPARGADGGAAPQSCRERIARDQAGEDARCPRRSSARRPSCEETTSPASSTAAAANEARPEPFAEVRRGERRVDACADRADDDVALELDLVPSIIGRSRPRSCRSRGACRRSGTCRAYRRRSRRSRLDRPRDHQEERGR